MPEWTFPPAIHDMPRPNGFSDTDISAITHQKAESLYPALAAAGAPPRTLEGL
jgi:hypothetical protein